MDDRVAATLREDATMATLVDRYGPLDIAPAKLLDRLGGGSGPIAALAFVFDAAVVPEVAADGLVDDHVAIKRIDVDPVAFEPPMELRPIGRAHLVARQRPHHCVDLSFRQPHVRPVQPRLDQLAVEHRGEVPQAPVVVASRRPPRSQFVVDAAQIVLVDEAGHLVPAAARAVRVGHSFQPPSGSDIGVAVRPDRGTAGLRRTASITTLGSDGRAMMRHDVDIVGGGCVGLSVAKHLTERTDLDVAVLEKEHHLASHQSGRSSGVLHPGFNYPLDSKKARFATEGTAQMKAYCEEHDVPCEELGVLVVATDDEEETRLADLAEQAEANGVAYELLDSREAIREHEPHADGQAALHAPEAASVDAEQYVYALAREVREAGVTVYTGYEVSQIEAAAEGADSTRATAGSRSRTSSTPQGSTPTPWPIRSASARSTKCPRSGESTTRCVPSAPSSVKR